MHEATIAQAILDKVSKRVSLLDKPLRVEKIFVRAGEFRNVDPESLKFAFDSLKGDYFFCRNSVLEIQLVKTLALCRQAHQYHPCVAGSFRCGQCGEGMDCILFGEELEIVDMELTVNEDKENCRYARSNN